MNAVSAGRGDAVRSRILELIERYFGLSGEEAGMEREEFEPVRLAGGEWLFRQGDAAESLYFLVRGRLQVWHARLEEDGGTREVMLGEVTAGETVGEIGLLTGKPRTASIRAARDSLLIEVDRSRFERLVARHPQMALKLAGGISERLHQRTSGARRAERRFVNICFLPLDRSDNLTSLASDLAAAVERHGSMLELDPGRLGEVGCPVAAVESTAPIPDELASWLDEQEDRFRYLIYHARTDGGAWSEFAVRQADLVVVLADRDSPPEMRDWEPRLLDAGEQRLAPLALVLLRPAGRGEISSTARWLDERLPDFHLHAEADNQDDLERVARVLAGRAVGLVLGAGAARGFAHIGVYRALVELGVPVDWVGGSSIGAVFAAGIAQGLSPGDLADQAVKGLVRDRPFSEYTLPLVSLLGGRRMLRNFQQRLPGEIEDLPLPFFCVSSTLDSGAQNVHERGAVARALHASAALPGIFPPAVVDRHLTVDGAVLNPLPVDVMRARPVGDIIAVDLSSTRTHEVDYDRVPSAWKILAGRWLPFVARVRAPGLAAVVLKSTEIGTLKEAAAIRRQADVLLQPPVRKYGMTQVKAFQAIMDAGYRHAMEVLPGWLEQRNAEEKSANDQPR